MPRSELNIKDIAEAKRVKVGRARDRRQEILVRFVDVETRDRISTYAGNLGDFIEKGKPTATFRHDIPIHLAGNHRTLMPYGHALRNRYGKELRWNVRFDDVGKQFVIDILIPGQEKWETVSYERALLDCKQQEAELEKKRGNALSSNPALAQPALSPREPFPGPGFGNRPGGRASEETRARSDGTFAARSSTSHSNLGSDRDGAPGAKTSTPTTSDMDWGWNK